MWTVIRVMSVLFSSIAIGATDIQVNAEDFSTTQFACDTLLHNRTDVFPIGFRLRTLVARDFDGDSLLDLAVASEFSNQVIVLINQGGVTFAAPRVTMVGANPMGLASADIDKDGDLDLAVTNTNSNTLSILTNDGFGNFLVTANYPTGVFPDYISFGELNGDSLPDIAISNLFGNSITIYLNHGTSEFLQLPHFPTTQRPTSIKVCDIDGDGDDDILYCSTTGMNELLNEGNNSFSIGTSIGIAGGSGSFNVADMDSDYDLDIVVSTATGISVYRNTANQFSLIGTSSVATYAGCPGVSDLDLDGDIDVVLSHDGAGTYMTTILVNDSTGNFCMNYEIGGLIERPVYSTCADLDNDFDPDVVLVHWGYGFSGLTIIVNSLDKQPQVSEISFPYESSESHVTTQFPTISWSASAGNNESIIASEIEVGTDNDWQYAEMWNPETLISTDSSVVYGGAPLIDGEQYWLRLRVSNRLGWSDWSVVSFRLNSTPTTPEQLLPSPGSNTSTSQPAFVIHKSSDAEVDSLYYTFEVSLDTAMSAPHSFTEKQDFDSLTSATIDIVLNENTKYFWRVRASDYYEESPWSAVHSFWVNTANSAPAAFVLTSPADSFSPPLATRIPTLGWTESVDIDPLDAVSYTLHLALDSNFTFVSVVSGISSNQYMPSSALVWGTRYWWKVKAVDLNGGETWSTQVFRFRTMALGDADGTGTVTVSDVVFLINYIFSGGSPPNPLSSGDADCSGAISISDAVYLIQYIFGGGPMPCEG